MTVQELIEELSLYPDDMEVEFAYNYGDYWRTTVCKEIKNIDTGYVEYSAYHRMNKLLDNDDEEDDEEETETKREVLLLQ
ncbi:MAG: hypothetical protein UIC65_04725 [Alphaproteobacteria bacterium]|nr:hypothetical protein [Alphaproteobacteria bacterium]